MNELMSIAVIGGADGPTAIYVAAKTSPWVWGSAAFIVAGIIWVCVRAVKKHKKGKNK